MGKQWKQCLKESLGPRKENNSLKGPLLNHLTSEKTKQNFSSTLMLQTGCIYLGLITPCPETFPPPTPAQKTYCPLPNYKCHLNKRILKISRLINVSLIASTSLPINMKPPWSLSVLSLVVRPTVAPPCLNEGNLLLLRSSFLFCLAGTVPYILGAKTREGARHSSHSLSLSLPLTVSPFSLLLSLFPESGSANILRAHFSARALKFPSGTPSAFMSAASLVLRLYWWFAYPQAWLYPLFSLSLTTSRIGTSCHSTALHATLHSGRSLD